MNRNLDGCYFRIKRGNKWENVCFSDLTKQERELPMFKCQTAKWWRSIAFHLADQLQAIGEELDIVGE